MICYVVWVFFGGCFLFFLFFFFLLCFGRDVGGFGGIFFWGGRFFGIGFLCDFGVLSWCFGVLLMCFPIFLPKCSSLFGFVAGGSQDLSTQTQREPGPHEKGQATLATGPGAGKTETFLPAQRFTSLVKKQNMQPVWEKSGVPGMQWEAWWNKNP